MMITFFIYFQETYNNRLRERYGDDTLTHLEFDPDLWMEVGSSGGPDKNQVYGLSNTMADNLRSTRSVSIVRSSQSISSSQSKEFEALQQHTAQLNEKYDNLSAEYAQLKASHA
jgi:acyl carrier protein phosphodiesterase